MAGAAEGATGLEKLILFRVGGESFALPILQAQEVVSGFALTRVPTLPAAYRGVVGVRGAAIPVVDLRERLFGAATTPDAPDARVIVLDLQPAVGLLVESVHRVAALSRDRMAPVPAASGAAPSRALAGMIEMERGRFALLLDAPGLALELEQGVEPAPPPALAADDDSHDPEDEERTRS